MQSILCFSDDLVTDLDARNHSLTYLLIVV
jgi:hypothetical protein